MYVVYLLYSEKFNKIYIGFTSDLINRFASHNSLATKGYTIKFRPWKVVYLEFFDDKNEAMKREKELKSSRGRDFCKKQISFNK
ncbi:MAG: GIY-YIG nuclease family protein [Fluviicola sp.]|jgi:putative endonuclease|nr:GIY-YIG nuclease family protein [Fluviicola sp.]